MLKAALKLVRNTLRDSVNSQTSILLGSGGAHYFKQCIGAEFPRIQGSGLLEPALANAKSYYHTGQMRSLKW